jgi:hypothetical protein
VLAVRHIPCYYYCAKFSKGHGYYVLLFDRDLDRSSSYVIHVIMDIDSKSDHKELRESKDSTAMHDGRAVWANRETYGPAGKEQSRYSCTHARLQLTNL